MPLIRFGFLVDFQVVMELVAGLIFCLWAALTVPGKFLSILPQSDENRFLSSFFSLLLICLKNIVLCENPCTLNSVCKGWCLCWVYVELKLL